MHQSNTAAVSPRNFSWNVYIVYSASVSSDFMALYKCCYYYYYYYYYFFSTAVQV